MNSGAESIEVLEINEARPGEYLATSPIEMEDSRRLRKVFAGGLVVGATAAFVGAVLALRNKSK